MGLISFGRRLRTALGFGTPTPFFAPPRLRRRPTRRGSIPADRCELATPLLTALITSTPKLLLRSMNSASLGPLGEARLGHIGLDEWLRRSQTKV
jgi:hypothetical protein